MRYMTCIFTNNDIGIIHFISYSQFSKGCFIFQGGRIYTTKDSKIYNYENKMYHREVPRAVM